jgi:3-phosphoshikimate 1-carboxyvinyltransferase
MPFAVLCSALNIKSEFSGVGNLRIKESDRINSLQTELMKTGADIHTTDDVFFIEPGKKFIVNKFHPHNDHRIAMSFAALAVRSKVVIQDPHVVSKSYPEFWDQMKKAGFVVS